MSEPKLTILIPTFNRKDQLLELLRSIDQQGHYGDYKVLISDNHSDYNVRDIIVQSFREEFSGFVQVHSWSFNTGMATNISVPFLFVDTEWCWVIGDDDTITEGALSRVLTDIQVYNDVLAIKYSLENVFPAHRDIYIDNLKEFASYYNESGRGGEMMYLSMVYNLNNLSPYLSALTEYSYTYLSFLIPVMKGLIEGKGIRFSSFGAISYRRVSNDNWASERYLKVALGIRTMLDVPFKTDEKTLCLLQKVLVKNITIGSCSQSIFKVESKHQRSIIWKNIRPMLKLSTPLIKYYCGVLLYYLYQWFGINLYSTNNSN